MGIRVKDLSKVGDRSHLDNEHFFMLDSAEHGTEKVAASEVLGGGSSSVAILFKTVADMQAASLNVGDVVETAGFYSVNDGGGAKYQIQSTGTANGMDLIAVASGKIAKVLLIREGYPEQIGYEVKASSASADDLTPYLQRFLAMRVLKIRFHAKSYYYYMKTPLVIENNLEDDVEFVGDLAVFSGYSSRIDYLSSATTPSTDECMFKLERRRIKFKNLYLQNSSSKDVPCFLSNLANSRHEGYEFDTIHISQFDYAFKFVNDLAWQYSFRRVNVAQCRIGLYTEHTFFMMNLNECYFSATECDVYSKSEFNAVVFENCNFECNTRCCVFENREMPASENLLFRLGDVNFTSCSFEFHTHATIPQNTQACFVSVNDLVQMEMIFNNCNFSLQKLRSYSGQTITDEVKTTTCLGFGELTRATFIDCRGPNYQTLDLGKYLFDSSKPTTKEVGSLTIIGSHNIVPKYDDAHLPVINFGTGVIKISNSTQLLSDFAGIVDGQQFYNVDDGCLYVKIGNTLNKITTNSQNIVRVGDENYNYVVIGSRKWVTSNIKLWTTNSNIVYSKARGYHEEFGCYYKFADLQEIQSKLPQGWRIPSQADFDNLMSSASSGSNADKAHALQSTNYSTIFTAATNSTGFNGMPSGNFTEANQPVTGYYMGNTTNLCLVLRAGQVLTYNYITDSPNIQPTLRICADA